MIYRLTIYLNDKDGIESKEIGEFDTWEKATDELIKITTEGYKYQTDRKDASSDYWFYPPSSIVKYHIFSK